MNKTTISRGLTLSAVAVSASASVAAQSVNVAPTDTGVYSWPFLVFLGIAMIGAISAIVWDLKSY